MTQEFKTLILDRWLFNEGKSDNNLKFLDDLPDFIECLIIDRFIDVKEHIFKKLPRNLKYIMIFKADEGIEQIKNNFVLPENCEILLFDVVRVEESSTPKNGFIINKSNKHLFKFNTVYFLRRNNNKNTYVLPAYYKEPEYSINHKSYVFRIYYILHQQSSYNKVFALNDYGHD